MGIENLLAQGYRSNIEPYGNALMRAQQYKMQQAQMKNALMQGEDLHAQRGQALEQAKQAQANALMQQQWRESIPAPQMAAAQQGLAGGGGPTQANAARIPAVDPRLQALHGGMRAGAVSPMDYINAANPKQEFVTMAPGASRVDSRTNQVAFTAPDKAKADEFSERLRAAGIDPASPQGRAMMMDKLRKDSTHAPPSMAISYGSPVPVVGPDGQVHYAQPGNRPGAAPQLMVGADGKPLQKPAGNEKDPTEGERKAATLLQRLRGSQSQLSGALNTTPGAAKPGYGSEIARSVAGDTAANLVTPEARQQVEAAQLDMLDAALTLATGAAYTKEQLQGHRRSYFPQIGDDRKTVFDKQERLKNVISAAEIAAGRAVKSVPKFDGAAPNDMPDMNAIDAEIARRRKGK